MNELERFEKLKKLGYVYEPETGLVKRNGEVRGHKNKRGYIILGLENNKKIHNVKAHRFAWWLIHNEIPNIIDHINHIKDDNRLENIRNVDLQKNQFNRKVKGYTFCKIRNKFQSQIVLNGKNHFLGRFNTEQEAIEAYHEAKKIHHII